MFVKICGVTSEEDALLAVAMGADAVGFVLAPSSRQISPQKVRDIVRHLPPEIVTVGVFRDELPARVAEIVNTAGLRAAQLHGHESRRAVSEVRPNIRLLIKAFVAGSEELDRADEYPVDAILVEGSSPGSGEVFDWRLLDGQGHRQPVLLAGGLHPGNVAEAVRVVRPWGVDVASGVESSPGVKDPRKVRAFIRAARAAGEELVASSGAPLSGPTPFDWREEL